MPLLTPRSCATKRSGSNPSWWKVGGHVSRCSSDRLTFDHRYARSLSRFRATVRVSGRRRGSFGTSVGAPTARTTINRLPRRKIIQKHTPAAASSGKVTQKHPAPQTFRSWLSTPLRCCWQEWLNQQTLQINPIIRVGLDRHWRRARGGWPGPAGHPGSPNGNAAEGRQNRSICVASRFALLRVLVGAQLSKPQTALSVKRTASFDKPSEYSITLRVDGQREGTNAVNGTTLLQI
jgi:hypothetical protein